MSYRWSSAVDYCTNTSKVGPIDSNHLDVQKHSGVVARRWFCCSDRIVRLLAGGIRFRCTSFDSNYVGYCLKTFCDGLRYVVRQN